MVDARMIRTQPGKRVQDPADNARPGRIYLPAVIGLFRCRFGNLTKDILGALQCVLPPRRISLLLQNYSESIQGSRSAVPISGVLENLLCRGVGFYRVLKAGLVIESPSLDELGTSQQ